MKKILSAFILVSLVFSLALVQISPVFADDNPVPPASPDESWQPPDETGQIVEPPVPVEQYGEAAPSTSSPGTDFYPYPSYPPGYAGSIYNAYLTDAYGRIITTMYGNQAIYLVVSFNGPGYFYLWEYYPYPASPYGHWLCYRWYRPYGGSWRIGPFVAQSFDPSGRYTWRMWYSSGGSWSTRILHFNYIRGYYPPDVPGYTPTPVYNPATISSFTASKSAIQGGETVVLSWSTSNATSVTISPGVGTVASSGSTTVTPSATTTYTLSASGQSSSAVTSTATVTVMPKVSPSLSLSLPTIKSGQSASLTWNAPGAVSVYISGIGSVNSNGTSLVSPRQTTTYTLTASYVDGTSQSTSATVGVEQPPYLLWGLIALLAVAVIVIAVLLGTRGSRARPARQAATAAAARIDSADTDTGDTDTEDTELATTPVAVAEAAPAKLKLKNGNDILLAGNSRSLGRRDFEEFIPSAQVSYISRQHINIWTEKGRYYIEDRSSTNGTKVNGMDIKGTGRHALEDGDVIELAGKLNMSFKTQNN